MTCDICGQPLTADFVVTEERSFHTLCERLHDAGMLPGGHMHNAEVALGLVERMVDEGVLDLKLVLTDDERALLRSFIEE